MCYRKATPEACVSRRFHDFTIYQRTIQILEQILLAKQSASTATRVTYPFVCVVVSYCQRACANEGFFDEMCRMALLEKVI